jgi:hypothetical protein
MGSFDDSNFGNSFDPSPNQIPMDASIFDPIVLSFPAQPFAATQKSKPRNSMKRKTRIYKELHSQGWQNCKSILSKHSSHGNTLEHV